MEQYLKTLADHHLRATKPREAVFSYLRAVAKPVDMKTITAELPILDRVTIYRIVDVFTRVGIVAVVPVGWKRRYELAESFVPHRHHIICVGCGASRDVRSPLLETAIHQASRDAGYIEIGHTIEVTGYCPNCQLIN